MTKLSNYEFVKETPINLVKVPGFLQGDFAKDFLEEFQGIARADYDDASALSVLSSGDGTLKGSNSYAVVLANQVLPENVRTATPADIGRIENLGSLDLRRAYVDTALVLRPQGNLVNEYLTNDLSEQVKSRGYELGETPLMMPLVGLQLAKDSNSPSGLAFKLTDASQVIEAPQLSAENDYKGFDEFDEIGLPIFGEGGERTNWTSNLSLSRVYFGRGGLGSWDDDLAVSGVGGRVVLVDAEGGALKND